jgi:hypothetical protein
VQFSKSTFEEPISTDCFSLWVRDEDLLLEATETTGRSAQIKIPFERLAPIIANLVAVGTRMPSPLLGEALPRIAPANQAPILRPLKLAINRTGPAPILIADFGGLKLHFETSTQALTELLRVVMKHYLEPSL